MLHTFQFSLNNPDKNVGTVYLPTSDCLNIPVIIYCHGWGGSRQLNPSTNLLMQKVTSSRKAGFVTFDFFGCGETGGDYTQMTYSRWKDNLSDIVDWVTKQSWANKERIGFFAISSGTTAALRLAMECKGLAFIISVATCISTHIGMSTGGPGKIFADHIESLMNGGTAELFGVSFGIDFFKDTISNAPIMRMNDIKCPVFFLQGEADNPFRRSDAKMGFEFMQKTNQPAKYKEIKGGDHALDNRPEECVASVMNWLGEIAVIDSP